MKAKTNSLIIISMILFSIFSPCISLAVETNNGKIIMGDLEYEYKDGYYQITDAESGMSTFLGFAISGNYNGNPILKATPDFEWNTPALSGDIATIKDTSGAWETEFDFSNDNAKITNSITNLYPNSITNAEFYYVLSVKDGDIIKVLDKSYVVSDGDNRHWTNADYDLNTIASEIRLRGITFNYRDIIDSGFDIQDVYIRDGGILGYNNQMVVAIGFTKGNGIIGSGQTVVIDPTIEDGVFGYRQTTVNDVNLENGTINVEDGVNSTFVVSVPGIADSVAIEEGNISTYPDGMVAGYEFDGDSVDFTGNGYNGTDTNMSYVDGAIFNGIDSLIDIGTHDLDDGFTIALKVAMNSTSINYGIFDNFRQIALFSYANANGFTGFVQNSTLITSYLYSGVKSTNKKTIVISYNNTTALLYIDNILESTVSNIDIADTPTGTFEIGKYATTYGKMEMDYFILYNRSLDSSEIVHITTRQNGSSIKPTSGTTFYGFQNNTATFQATTDSITFASTTAGTANVTVTQYWFDDYTLIEETVDGTDVNIAINHTALNNYTNAYIEYEPTNNPLYNLGMNSTNNNASYVYSDGIINITTGLLNVDDNFFYNFTARTTLLEAPDNLTAVPGINYALLDWDDTYTNHSVCFAEPTIYYANWSLLGISPPTVDGIFDDDVGNFSQEGVLPTPNPVNPLDYDQIYAVHDDTYVHFGAKTHDNDADSNDDSIEVYFDFEQDGLTSGDIGYRLIENGAFARFAWSDTANKWVAYGASGATYATGGAGTNDITYEMRIPLSELPLLIPGNYVDLVVRRTNTHDATVYSYFPYSTGYTIDSSDGWQTLLFSNVSEPEPTFTFYTNETYYNVTGLDSYSWYMICVSGYENDTKGNSSCVEFITLDYPRYNVSGNVYDDITWEPIAGALVIVTDSFTQAFTTTDINGSYSITGLHNDDYIFTYSYDDYYVSYENVTVADANITGLDVYLEMDETMTTIPLTMFYVLIGVLAFLVFMSFRGIREDGVYLDNIVFSALSMIFSFYLSKITINGTIVYVEKFISSADRIITSTNPVVNSSLSSLFEYVGIIFVLVTLGLIYAFIQERRVIDD